MENNYDSVEPKKKSNWLTWVALALISICCFSKNAPEAEYEKKVADGSVVPPAKALFEYRPISSNNRTVAFNTAYQPSLARWVIVNVSAQIACTVTIAGGQAGSISLQTSPDGTTYTTISQITNSSTGTLVVGLTLNNINGSPLTAVVPPGGYYKIVSTSTTGTPTFTINTISQELSF